MRLALLGSPGIAIPYRPVFKISGVGVSKIGAGGTFAAVAPGDVLVIHSVNFPTAGNLGTVTFAGTENSPATFAAAINAQSKGLFSAVVVGGQITLFNAQKGSLSIADVTAATSAAVLASLGITATAFATAATQAQAPYGRAATVYDGSRTAPFHQKFLAAIGYGRRSFVLDRNAAATVFSDDVRQTPNPVA